MVDELAPAVRIEDHQIEREPRRQLFDAGGDPLRGVVADRVVLGPAVTRSVIVRVRANSPIRLGPQCATVSASMTPGVAGASSAQVRTVIELRSSANSFVVDMPLIAILSRAGFRYRSTVAALIACSSANACSVANGLSRITGGGQQRQPQLQHDHQVLAARHAHQRPHMLQQRPGIVAEAPRPQRAPIDPSGRVG